MRPSLIWRQESWSCFPQSATAIAAIALFGVGAEVKCRLEACKCLRGQRTSCGARGSCPYGGSGRLPLQTAPSSRWSDWGLREGLPQCTGAAGVEADAVRSFAQANRFRATHICRGATSCGSSGQWSTI